MSTTSTKSVNSVLSDQTETNQFFHDILGIISNDSDSSEEIYFLISFDTKGSADLWVNKSRSVLQDTTNTTISSKRSYINKTTEICHTLLQPFISTPKHAEDLLPLLQVPLTCKLSVAANEESKYPELQDFIYTCEIERESDIAIHISGILSSNINFKKHLGKGLPINLDWNRSDPGSTKGYERPDFLCWVKDALLIKGKKKADIDQFDVAASELVSKFNILDPRKFGDIKFMMGYAAAGPLVQFYAIDRSSKRLVPLSDQLNINSSQDRISLIRITINIARVIITIKDIIPDGFSDKKKKIKKKQ
ncbi:23393_t:CDS:2 [Dentiscutata erythropus]|uniref:23393_t:CDS:1 n=1 Tax=Dentiscutata erythropus TaxID=1348616 RepID=A0A9N9B5P7_9GLOM|nr:23393_t:CDS:2 [Dentiscutata erythropus]